ncbi:MAG: lipocalin-like domain-containing protein [Candidatus Marinimicrobia bacterium]|nr:lipocalin-like domain-containing protein [Candidatus Neomarinimicrobiota bacterium]
MVNTLHGNNKQLEGIKMHKTEKLYRISAVSIVLLAGLLIAGCKQKVESKPWEGSWIVSNWATPDGEELPLKGLAHYYPDGKFASQMMESERLDLDTDPETLEELKDSFSTYRAGFGTYSVDEQAGKLTYSYDGNMRTHRVKDEPTTVTLEITGDDMVFNYDEGGKLVFLR